MLIWDVHCHLSGVPGRTPDERLAQLVAFADRMGIERLCVFMGMNWSYDPSPDDMRKQNDEVLAALERWHHRAFGFVYLNPNHVEASLAELDRCVRDGPMVGVKLWVARHCNAPELDPIVKRAGELKAPVLQHTYLKITGNLPGESTPSELAELARRHPDVAFIAAHTGADWEVGHSCYSGLQECVCRIVRFRSHRRLHRNGRPRAWGRAGALRQRRRWAQFCFPTGEGVWRRYSGIGEAADPGREQQAPVDADTEAERR